MVPLEVPLALPLEMISRRLPTRVTSLRSRGYSTTQPEAASRQLDLCYRLGSDVLPGAFPGPADGDPTVHGFFHDLHARLRGDAVCLLRRPPSNVPTRNVADSKVEL
jgi:hypothetical protein